MECLEAEVLSLVMRSTGSFKSTIELNTYCLVPRGVSVPIRVFHNVSLPPSFLRAVLCLTSATMHFMIHVHTAGKVLYCVLRLNQFTPTISIGGVYPDVLSDPERTAESVSRSIGAVCWAKRISAAQPCVGSLRQVCRSCWICDSVRQYLYEYRCYG